VLSNQPGRWRLLTAAIFHDPRAAQQRQPPSPGSSLSTQPGMVGTKPFGDLDNEPSV
jgi:hypothetical protein